MPGAPKPRPLADLVADTVRVQREASDPTASAWVAANAGTGKTYVLAARVLRLLLAGSAPETILCLTYTKAAAAEMSKRVFDRLAEWVIAPPDVLERLLTDLMGRAPGDGERQRARELFALTIETPGGLKVQTIHAFCERLLQRFPLEAGVPAGFSTLDDGERSALIDEAINEVLAEVGTEPAGALAQALAIVVPYAAEDGFTRVVTQALGHRDWLELVSRRALLEVDGGTLDRIYARVLDVPLEETLATVEERQGEVLSLHDMSRCEQALRAGSKSDIEAAGRLASARQAQTTNARIEALAELLLTKDGDPRKRLMTKAVIGADPALHDLLVGAQAQFAALEARAASVRLRDATVALMTIADAVMQHYADAKARRAALDFDDLIARSVSMLGSRDRDGPVSSITQWVLFKLDGRLEHILVDEAQDTSPSQWRVIEALAAEFFTGEGAHGGRARTLFAVGDEKQSIYSFQGAAPDEFRRMGADLARRAAVAGLAWRRLPMSLSFRSGAPVLAAVDRVLADPQRAPGIVAGGECVEHLVRRQGQAGLVELWAPAEEEAGEASEAFAPLEERSTTSAGVRLAQRIGDCIAGWLARGEKLDSHDRQVRAGDILILLRKRRPLAPIIIAALKARGVPVAGADRMRLTEQIAVLDLIALGDFLVLPEDDLALAAVLKSPLVGLGDDDLLGFAPQRKGTLWSALLAAGKADPRLAAAAERLKRWRARADVVPPYELYATILDRDGARADLLARLGAEAADALDAFLGQAIAYDEAHPPSLTGFLDALRRSDLEIKRDMEHSVDAVRVMTVHGAKGLEAPIVFLPDTFGKPSGGRVGGLVRAATSSTGAAVIGARERAEPQPILWPVKGTRRAEALADAINERALVEQAEHNRLLYVALTRARDRLYVCGAAPKNAPPAGCWHETMRAALEPVAEWIETEHGAVLRLAQRQTAPPDNKAAIAMPVAAVRDLPAWLTVPAPREPQRLMPVAPSRLLALETDAEGEPRERTDQADREPPLSSPLALAEERRFLRGTITHALLEHLPPLAPRARGDAARAIVAAFGPDLPEAMAMSIVAETLRVLEHPGLEALFGPLSRAEVPVVAEVAPPDGRGPALRITGSIDRLAILDHEVLIADYKTNRSSPATLAGVPAAYVAQLAAYRLAVGRLFGHTRVRAALVWTDRPLIMAIPSEMLDAAELQLWSGASDFEAGP